MNWNVAECPGCGATCAIGIMSLACTCKYCGLYYADVNASRGWYSSREAYEKGTQPVCR